MVVGFHRVPFAEADPFERRVFQGVLAQFTARREQNVHPAAPQLHQRAQPQFRLGFADPTLPNLKLCHNESPAPASETVVSGRQRKWTNYMTAFPRDCNLSLRALDRA